MRCNVKKATTRKHNHKAKAQGRTNKLEHKKHKHEQTAVAMRVNQTHAMFDEMKLQQQSNKNKTNSMDKTIDDNSKAARTTSKQHHISNENVFYLTEEELN